MCTPVDATGATKFQLVMLRNVFYIVKTRRTTTVLVSFLDSVHNLEPAILCPNGFSSVGFHNGDSLPDENGQWNGHDSRGAYSLARFDQLPRVCAGTPGRIQPCHDFFALPFRWSPLVPQSTHVHALDHTEVRERGNICKRTFAKLRCSSISDLQGNAANKTRV